MKGQMDLLMEEDLQQLVRESEKRLLRRNLVVSAARSLFWFSMLVAIGIVMGKIMLEAFTGN